MKLKKLLLMAAMTTAIGCVSAFPAFADEDDAVEDTVLSGWVQDGSNWRYYDSNGNAVTGWVKAEEGDGRGNEVWYYIDPSTGLMLYNTTRVIGDVSYTFEEDGSWMAPAPTAPKGTVSGGVYTNTWANIRIPQVIGSVESDYEATEQFSDSAYEAIGQPTLSHDLYLSTDFGDLEIYFANMANKPSMTATEFASTLAEIEKGKIGQVSAVENVTIGGQEYAKVTITRVGTKKTTLATYYCRKQGDYMVVIYTYGRSNDAGSLESIVNTITTAQ